MLDEEDIEEDMFVRGLMWCETLRIAIVGCASWGERELYMQPEKQNNSLTLDHLMDEYDQIEALAAVDHDQWCHWSQAIMRDMDSQVMTIAELNNALLKSDPNYNRSKLYKKIMGVLKKHNDLNERWNNLWCAYKKLPESAKEHDRVWAKKEYDAIRKTEKRENV